MASTDTPSQTGPTQAEAPVSPDAWRLHQAYFYNDSTNSGLARFIIRHWWPELLGCLGSLICLAAIVIVLAEIDGKNPEAIFGSTITINTFLAFCVTLSKICFGAVAAGSLAQLHWEWFIRPNQLGDIRLFHNGADGFLGSLTLIGCLPPFRLQRILPSLAALISISGILTSTVTQQMISIQSAPGIEPNGTALASRVTLFSRYNGTDFEPSAGDRLAIREAILAGAYANGTVQDIAPQCSSADCLWPEFGTLGFCSEVRDITQTANPALLNSLGLATFAGLLAMYLSFNGTINYSFDHGAGFVRPVYPVFIQPLLQPTGQLDDSVRQTAIVDVVISYSREPLNWTAGFNLNVSDLRYVEAALHFCTKQFATNITNSVPVTGPQVSRSQILAPSNPHSLNAAWSPDYAACWTTDMIGCNKSLKGSFVTLAPPTDSSEVDGQLAFSIELYTALSLSTVYILPLAGGVVQDRNLSLLVEQGSVSFAAATALYGDQNPLAPFDEAAQLRNLTALFGNVATASTNILRLLGRTFFYGDDAATAAESATVSGLSYTDQLYVYIRWPWLAFLATQVFLSCALLAATIVVNRKSGLQVLKGSVLAAMFAYCDPRRLAVAWKNTAAWNKALVDQADKTRMVLAVNSSGVADGLTRVPSPAPGPQLEKKATYEVSVVKTESIDTKKGQ